MADEKPPAPEEDEFPVKTIVMIAAGVIAAMALLLAVLWFSGMLG